MLKLDDLREKTFQRIIKEYLVKNNGYVEGVNKNYDRFYAIDRKMLFDFLNDTQKSEMTRLRDIYKNSFEEKIVSRIDSEITKRGILDVLKNGIKDRGQSLSLMYRKPATSYNKSAVELYNKNRFSVTEELVYSDEGRIDLVIFLNGIAIISFELKNNASGQNYKDAIKQYMDDRDPREKIFKFNERCFVNFAADTEEVYMTTKLQKRDTFFLPFNRGNNGGKGNPVCGEKMKVSYMWEDVLSKDTLLYLVDKFVYVQVKKSKDEKGKVITKKNIIFPRYHQIDVVRKVLSDVYINKTSKNYLIQHSAGSGKTNSIAWLSHRLMSLHDEDNHNIFDAIVVITDRTVIDKQLQDAVTSLDHKKGTIEVIDNDSNQLADSISNGTKIIVSTIQKFRFILDKLGVLKDKRFAIIIDEAHSSTSGKNMEAVTKALTMDEARNIDNETEEKDLEDEIIDEINRNGKQPNISMFAFTATPKPATLDMFGTENLSTGKKEAFHLYSMRQAIEEGFILDVLKNYVTYETFYNVTRMVEDDPSMPKAKVKRAVAKKAMLHPTNISQKVEIIIEHFRRNVMHKINGKAKAMVVTSSRVAAVKYRLAFEKYIKQKGYQNIKALVAFTGIVKLEDEDKEFTEISMNGFREEELPRKFATDEYQVLLVADKYQTGFDQPLLHTMYIDKKLEGVKAVQTLSRLNRTTEGKDDTFILDFRNKVEDIAAAFSKYYESVELKESLDPNSIYDFERKIEEYDVIDREDIDKFIKVAFKESKSSRDKQAQYSYISKALDRVNQFDNEEKIKIRAVMKKFITLYGLLIQISEFEDIELHKLYIFLKFLVKAIEVERDMDIDISDKVTIENFRQVKGKEISIDLKPTGEISHGGLGVHFGPEQKFDVLSNIIKEINEIFGTDFGENEKLASMQIEETLKSSQELERRAKNNSLENFKYAYKKEYEDAIIKSLSQNQDFFEMLLVKDEMKNKFMDFMVERVYEHLVQK